MSLTLVHTSDWHLGHALHGVTREYEHARFLAWLVAACEREEPDLVVVTGDVFDSATPPASAERMWFDTVAAIAGRGADIIVIAGNHDSPGRLGAPAAVLRELGVHVIGALPRACEDAVLEVAGGRAIVAAVPFLRASDVGETDAATVYKDVLAAARARRRPGQALIATGHLYLAGAAESKASERPVSIGGIEAATPRLFGDDVDYVALGHLHKPQRVWRDTVRYAGSPIAMSFDEVTYRHQIVVASFGDDGRCAGVRALEVPRAVELVRVRGGVDDVLAELAALPDGDDAADPTRPLLDVVVALAAPEPRLRARVEAALDGKRPRLVRLLAEATGDGAALAERVAQTRLQELDPRDVFVRCWERRHADPPGEPVLAAFDRLVSDVRDEAADVVVS
jgi:exonuclease SbcD|nr:exonuclease SbcCD subunit D C-terminal domain-containing protein [Kofleriaceae bacterium]